VGEESVLWKQYDTTTKAYLNFDTIISQERDLKAETVQLWSEQIPPAETLDDVTNIGRDEL